MAHDHAFQGVAFHRQLFEPRLDHVADGDDADQFVVFGHRHMAKAPVRHALQHVIRGVVAPAAGRVARHHVVDRLGQADRAPQGQAAHDVAF